MRRSKLINPWVFRKKLKETEKQFHGHNENEKMPGEKASFLQPAFFLVFPDA